MNSSPSTPGVRIRSWLANHWPTSAGTALLCLGIFLAFHRAPPAPAGIPHSVLSRRQVRQAEQAQAARLDSIQREVRRIPHLLYARDSALVAARRQNDRANYLLKRLSHETPASAPPTGTGRLVGALANYQPGTYALDSTTSIR